MQNHILETRELNIKQSKKTKDIVFFKTAYELLLEQKQQRRHQQGQLAIAEPEQKGEEVKEMGS
jgi:hypothetical protein